MLRGVIGVCEVGESHGVSRSSSPCPEQGKEGAREGTIPWVRVEGDMSRIPSKGEYLEADSSEVQTSMDEADAGDGSVPGITRGEKLASPALRAQTQLFALPICIPVPKKKPRQSLLRKSQCHVEVLLMCSGWRGWQTHLRAPHPLGACGFSDAAVTTDSHSCRARCLGGLLTSSLDPTLALPLSLIHI